MSIIITNVSEDYDIPYGSGVQHYELKINRNLMAEFTHTFEDGLSECLRKAADAFDKQETMGLHTHWVDLSSLLTISEEDLTSLKKEAIKKFKEVEGVNAKSNKKSTS